MIETSLYREVDRHKLIETGDGRREAEERRRRRRQRTRGRRRRQRRRRWTADVEQKVKPHIVMWGITHTEIMCKNNENRFKKNKKT